MSNSYEPELSKSRFFTIVNGKVITAEGGQERGAAVKRAPQSIIDQKYQILGMLGQGGMGAVYKAHHLMLNKDVALKTFQNPNLSEEARLRFQREAQAIAKLNHRNIIQVFDYGLCEDGVPYYTMEYLTGLSLADRISKRGPLKVDEAIALFTQVCQGLALAHSKGVIHRDLKPANIFVEKGTLPSDKAETVKIVDFGIASLTEQGPNDQRLTSKGMVFGSPLYMSPEQAMGQSVTERADIYSVGCSLFEALTGSPPFEGEHAFETLMLHQTGRIPTLTQKAPGRLFPVELERTIATMLAKSPRQRQGSMEQVAAELRAVSTSKSTSAPLPVIVDDSMKKVKAEPEYTGEFAKKSKLSTMLIVGGLVVVSMTALAGTFLVSDKPAPPPSVPSKISEPIQNPAAAATEYYGVKRQNGNLPTTGFSCKIEPRGGGRRVIAFTAPDDGNDYGYFENPFIPGGRAPARGTVRWPAEWNMKFVTTNEFIKNPANLDIFPPESLYELNITNCLGELKDAVLMSHLKRLTGLRSIIFGETEFTDKDIAGLDAFPELCILDIRRSNISGSSIARLKRLPEFGYLIFNDCSGGSSLINALKPKNKIQTLYMSGSGLNSRDFKTISTFPRLSYLQINRSNFKQADFAPFTNCKKLYGIEAEDCDVTMDVLDTFRTLSKNGMTTIKISGKGLSMLDRKKIRDLIPRAKFLVEDNSHSESVDTKEWKNITDRVQIP